MFKIGYYEKMPRDFTEHKYDKEWIENALLKNIRPKSTTGKAVHGDKNINNCWDFSSQSSELRKSEWEPDNEVEIDLKQEKDALYFKFTG